MQESADIVIVGAGAAGLMAAVQAGRERPGLAITLVDGARTLGAKILVAGGGRCNVTHHAVDERDFAGSTPPAIRRVLRGFGVDETTAFFAELGVELKREETGKLFPVTDKARTVLDALVLAARDAGVRIVHPFRVEALVPEPAGFRVESPAGVLLARRVVLATGGKSLPKSGSDGHGLAMVQGLGHGLTPRIEQALVPLLLPAGHPLTELKGIATPVRLEVRAPGRKRPPTAEGALLCTHFGLSGPAVLDISRHWLLEGGTLVVSWVPEYTPATLDAALQELRGQNPAAWLAARMPRRLADVLVAGAGLDPSARRLDLTRVQRSVLVEALTAMELPVTGPRGWTWAEVTAGGVPLAEVRLDSLESRRVPGLHLCGEILDVDGRIGGFNFQWAWASGTAAGRAAARAEADRSQK
ncbi:MAG: aminoacetone oxidase family FAD-binding enzyme [Planctomycetota bacterium]|nr:aminoacetone oxidase family FAD-binding enzyme [Planctomycetota bacterium]